MPGVKMEMARQQEGKHSARLGVKLSKNRKGWAKGKMEGKGGPLNPACTYRGVRQRQWGMWVAEIREPGKKKRLWLGTYRTADEAALIYDRASRQFYGPEGYQNLCEFPGKHDSDLKVPRSNSERQQQNVTRRVVDDRPVAPSSVSNLAAARLVSSSSTSTHHRLPAGPGSYWRFNPQSGGMDPGMVDTFNAAQDAGAPASRAFLTEDAIWKLQMGLEMKTERDEEDPLEDCYSDCSPSVTSASSSQDSREVASSCLSLEEEPAWDNFPEILSLPNDLQLLDEKSLIYFPKLVE